jgi:pimeloyl-ACP methyl ester carboxylesterase
MHGRRFFPIERTLVFALALLAVSVSLQAAAVDGLHIHSTTTGSGKTTVMLVHGYTCDETTWSEQVPALARQYRVITLDLPGHGKSDVPAVAKFSMDLFARAIEAVRAEAGADRVVLVGHSMGTPVILRYAHLYPQHTAALVMVDGVMFGAAPPVSGRGAMMAGPDGPANREAMVQRFFVAGTPPAVKDKVLHMMLAAPEATAVGAMNATFEPGGRTTQIPNVPVLAIYAGSPLAGREAVLSLAPNADYTQIAGTGHFLMLEQPAEFNRRLLEFLARL